MPSDRPSEPGQTISVHSWDYFHEAARHRWHASEPKPQASLSYLRMFGEESIQLGNVEFLILLFLASRPYHPFTQQRIAAAVTTEDNPVMEEDIDQHIASLRDQLGFFHDFVQTVPYVGYRFKA
jgi:DNA-binding response OmpR family regulator